LSQNLFSQSYAKERTEDDILGHTPIKLILGKKEFPAHPLTLRKGAEWRGAVAEVLNSLATGAMVGPITPEKFNQGIMVTFFDFPDKVLNLLILYAPSLEEHREWLLDTATDEELVIAFSRLMVVAYPYFSLLGSMRSAAMETSKATSRQ
jgi:hypothetical protein